MHVVRTDLPRIPTGDGHIALADDAEDFLLVARGVKDLFGTEIEYKHGTSPLVGSPS
jgi:hypothetical protein